ncbi:MAG: carboxypeptidase regulatory-like domain-containing protein [Clostridiales bacterium]|nr:carboxypeptidase regulatory-like domain-containing protein [Clostridiales bacterium]
MKSHWKSILSLALVLVLAAGFCTPARAAGMTLGITLTGIIARGDGTEETVPVTGTFRVFRNGAEIAEIRAGQETINLTGTDPVVLEPMPETFDPAWDLRDASRWVEMTDGAVVNVPIMLRLIAQAPETPELTAEPEAKTTAEPEAQRTEEPETGETGDPETEAENTEQPETESIQDTPGPAAFGETALPTPVPAPETTPEPEMIPLEAGDDTGTLRVMVFLDGNNNGVMGPYEDGISGIAVWILDESGNAVTGGRTGFSGEITFEGLMPGQYRIRAILPGDLCFARKGGEVGLDSSCMEMTSGEYQDSEPIAVRAGETQERGVGAGAAISVSGLCFLDANADGVMEKTDGRVPAIRIKMEGQKNGLVYETYSDESGNWQIEHVRPGFYDLVGYTPEGMMFTRYSSTGGKNRSIFHAEGRNWDIKTLDTNDGQSVTNQNIGFCIAGGVRGRCFLDANYNGLYDEGELPMAGVKVTAIKQLKDDEAAVTFSGEDGTYTLYGLRGNTYKLRAVLPDDGSNFTRVVSDPLGNHFQARPDRRENFWKDYEVTDGVWYEMNVGVIYYASVSGTVYLDDDFSADQNGSEKTVQGIAVTLLDADGNTVETKQTNGKGNYTFSGLTPGQYSLRMNAKEGYAFTRTGPGNVMLNQGGGQGKTELFDVPLGETVSGMDAGMIEPGRVDGTVFADLNDNGLRDGGENGLEGTVVRLIGEEGEAFRTTIGESGTFLFDSVMPGRYYVEYSLPEGAVFARTAEGGNVLTGEEGLGATGWFDFMVKDHWTAPLCGALTLGRISGTVFHDSDASGTWESGEEALSGAVIRLEPSRSDLEPMETVTGADGVYLLDALHPDTYTLTVRLPEGLVVSRLTEIQLPIRSGRETQESPLTIPMGRIWDRQELGAVKPASMVGQVWLDENNDGRWGEDEQTPAGMDIIVLDEKTGEVFETLKTDENGAFGTEGMIPGSFTVYTDLEENTDSAGPGDSTFTQTGRRLQMNGVVIREGEEYRDLMMGLVAYTSVGGSVWLDQGGEMLGLAGAQVTLETENGESAASMITGTDGTYLFEKLMPGKYRLRTELPEGYVVVEPEDERLAEGAVSVMTETDGRNGVSDLFKLKMGKNQLKKDIGSVLPGTIGDFCWLDVNGNGWQDGGELGIPGATVELQRNGETVATTVTEKDGYYWFRDIYPAVYTLKVTPPAEVRPTRKRSDIPIICSSLLEANEEEKAFYTDPIAVQSNVVNYNVDLGFVLRTPGVYPPGYGQGRHMDWSLQYQ